MRVAQAMVAVVVWLCAVQLAASGSVHAQAPAASAGSPPLQSTAPVPAAAVPAVAAPEPALDPRVAVEIQRLREERAGINSALPGVATYLGGSVGVTLVLSGALVLAIDCRGGISHLDEEETHENCEESKHTGRLMLAGGAVLSAIAIWGLVTVLNNNSRRKEIDARVRELQGERATLSFELVPTRHGGAVALTLSL